MAKKNTAKKKPIKKGVASFDAEIAENKAEGRIGIIQLSDLQFGKNHIFSTPKELSEKLISDIMEMSKNHTFTPHYLVLSGDITEEAKKKEFEQAEEMVQLLVSGLHIDGKHIICVPGNHDVNWSLCKAAKRANDDQLKFQLYNKFLVDIGCKEQRTRNSDYPLINEPLKKRTESKELEFNIQFALLNSSEKYDHKKQNHYPYVCTDKLKNTLKSQKNNDWLRIAILHHPLQDSSSESAQMVYAARPKQSLITKAIQRFYKDCVLILKEGYSNQQKAYENQRDVKAIIQSYELDIVLTGHTHEASFDSSISSNRHKVILAGSGSVGVGKSQRPESVPNQYSIHVIDYNKAEFESHFRAFVLKPSKQGKGAWDKDGSMVDNPTILELSALKATATKKQLEKSDLKSKKVDWGKDEFADELAVANLLGGWNE